MLGNTRNVSLSFARGGDDASAGLGMLVVFVLAIGIWLLVKIINIVYLAFAHHPKDKTLWIGAGLVLLSFTAAMLTNFDTTTTSLLIISGVVFVIMAKLVDLKGTLLLQEKTTTLDKVLRRPWWNSNSNNTLPQQKAA